MSILRQLEADGSGGFYFCGILDSATVVGRLDGVGQPVWLSQTAYSVRDLEVVLPTSDHLLVVGGQDVDGDRLSDVGFVSLYSESGTRRDQLLYDSDSSQVWWNSFASLSDSTFLIVGGERTANMVTPFITTVTLRPNGTLEKGDHKALASLPGRFFDNAVTDGAGLVAGPDIVFYALSDNGGITPIPTISVHKVSAASGVTSAGIEWSQSIVTGPGLGTFAGPGEYLALLDQNLYITGWTDCLKNRVPTDIGYWRDGLVASVATDGTLRWVTEVEVTMHNEQFL
ncbi:MAG: hypothetical protein OEN01_01685, partial [Candidatus Krumholzibacteria bacterium]|nr:hypothetical protein [Candidatus Krumholzibacteria bacterium]